MRELRSLSVRAGLTVWDVASQLSAVTPQRGTPPGRSQLQKPRFMAILLSTDTGSPQRGSQASSYGGASSNGQRAATDPAGAPRRTAAKAPRKQTESTLSSFQIMTNRPGQLSRANKGHDFNPHMLVAAATLLPTTDQL